MITHLRARNFKAWEDTGDVRLAPITVLFGGNSAGKTSIPQLLLSLKQTAESPDRQQVLHLGDARTLVDLGTYGDVVHGHDVEQPVAFALGWARDADLVVDDPLSQRRIAGRQLRFEATLRADKHHQPYVESFAYRLAAGDGDALAVGMTRRASGAKYDLVTEGYDKVRQPGRVWPLPPPQRFYGFPDEAIAYFQNTAFVSDLVLEMERLLKGIYYVGPLREYPKRLYLWSGEVPQHVGGRGDRAVEAILAARDRRFNWRPRQKYKPLDGLVAEKLRDMGLIHSFSVEPLGAHRNEYEVLVRVGAKTPAVRLTDVGFGVSQVLPVIVECFYVPAGSVVIFEQPEIHLHPRVQAELADLFVDAIRAREDGQPRNVQFIIESHSEHFLRRLQRRIAEGALAPEDAALYFVGSDEGTARLTTLEVDAFGNILNWPEGFFGDEMEDVVARAEAQARRSGPP